jgi:hypothetical protein
MIESEDDAPGVDEIGFYTRPQVEQLPDGSWRAYNPASDWSVTAETQEAAIAELSREDQRRGKEEPGYMVRNYEALRRHLVEPIPGVYAISNEEAERIRLTPDPEAEFERIADEMDAGRIPNPM